MSKVTIDLELSAEEVQLILRRRQERIENDAYNTGLRAAHKVAQSMLPVGEHERCVLDTILSLVRETPK